VAACYYGEQWLAADPQREVAGARELGGRGSVVGGGQCERARLVQERMVAQMCVGVADGYRECERRAKPAQLVSRVPGVRGQQRRKAPVERGVLGRLVLGGASWCDAQSLAAVFLLQPT
jgi:hypothetical protein